MGAKGERAKNFLASFERSLSELAGNGTGWTSELRRSALDRFSGQGLPTTDEEDWRFTNVQELAETCFELPPVPTSSARSMLPEYGLEELRAHRLVLVDGHFVPALSDVDSLPDGIAVQSLHDALSSATGAQPDLLSGGEDPGAFALLNSAFAQDGILLKLRANVRVDRPIHILSILRGGAAPWMCHPRLFVELERGAQLSLVEDHVGSPPALCLANVMTRLRLAEDAQLDHVQLIRESATCRHIGQHRSQLGRGAHLRSHTIFLEGGLMRDDVRARLEGAGSEVWLKGLVLGRHDQHVDNHTTIEHATSHTASREHFRNILDDSSHGVFSGRIYVASGAQKTDAEQSNANLLLSDDAQMDTMPQLEIYADDVKCSHGATLGQLDREGLLYLRSRGIDEMTSRALLVYAFANEVIEDLRLDALRTFVRRRIFDRLPHEHLNEEPM
jgi:Fe-S cluster assembly protein SufD